MTEREVIGGAKAAAYLILWIAAVVILLRIIVGQLWGSGSDLGMVAAVAALAVGIVGLAWLGILFYRDASRHFRATKGDGE